LEKKKNKLKVAVLAGGIGAERQISLQSGENVFKGLKDSGFETILSDINPDDTSILENKDVDVFFLALHGQFGEDGGLQEMLEERKLVYTGSGPKASREAFDKMAAKKLFRNAGVKTAQAVEFDKNTETEKIIKTLRTKNGKYVVKPIKQGSSVGVVIVGIDEVHDAAKKCLAEFGDCMIEEFIDGREITCGILCGRALPIVEVKTQTAFYDYHSKYIDDKTEYLFDTIEDDQLVKRIHDAALKCFNATGCRDFARIDFILAHDGNLYALEINTIPGLTSHSLLPKAAGKVGLSMSQLCVKIIESALQNKTANRR